MTKISSKYLDKDDNVTMCQDCKQTRNLERNEWVLNTNFYVNPPDNVIYVVCDRCSANDV